MSDHPLSGRRIFLEEAFFAREEAALRRRMSVAQDEKETREAFVEASGIADDALVGRLADQGIGLDTLAALLLVPVVVVAWADGHIDEKERVAVLSAATDAGLDGAGSSYRLLEWWLAKRPPPELFMAWKDYVGALSASTPPEARQSLKSEILKRVRGTAEASGGFLGFGRKTSSGERSVLAEVETAFLA